MSTTFFKFFILFVLPVFLDIAPAFVSHAATHCLLILHAGPVVLQFPHKIFLPDTTPPHFAPMGLISFPWSSQCPTNSPDE